MAVFFWLSGPDDLSVQAPRAQAERVLGELGVAVELVKQSFGAMHSCATKPESPLLSRLLAQCQRALKRSERRTVSKEPLE